MHVSQVSAYLITEGTYFVVCPAHVVESFGSRLKAKLQHLLDAGARELVLDLTATRTIDSPSLRGLAAIGRRATKAATVATFACDDEHVLWLLQIVGLERDFWIEPTVTDAFAQVAKRANRDLMFAA